ncbi:PilW family protein [Planococcus sp. 4-30]|uniref:PilW family protein n=1 Tax=Planococcus sp. 4-30 TaxID=2874583 RepID=UPI001CBFCF48|nr:type II secretion system protein [Planococcus sp. 4-30]
MKNEKGITLVELLAALAILGIIVIVIASVLSTGTTASNKTATKQQLQQEANLVVEVLRSEYLKSDNQVFVLSVEESNGEQILLLDSRPISQGYRYRFTDTEIDPNFDTKFEMTILDADGQYYEIDTTFSKLR